MGTIKLYIQLEYFYSQKYKFLKFLEKHHWEWARTSKLLSLLLVFAYSNPPAKLPLKFCLNYRSNHAVTLL